MVYTYAMWDEDGHQISEGLYETGARPTTTTGPDILPIELKGRMFALDADDLLLKAHSFFRNKYGPEEGDDFYLRWASILTFCREQAEPLSRHGIVQIVDGVMSGIDANFARMLLDSYAASPLLGGFPISPLHEGESGFSVGKTLDAWLSGKYFSRRRRPNADVSRAEARRPEPVEGRSARYHPCKITEPSGTPTPVPA